MVPLRKPKRLRLTKRRRPPVVITLAIDPRPLRKAFAALSSAVGQAAAAVQRMAGQHRERLSAAGVLKGTPGNIPPAGPYSLPTRKASEYGN